MPSTIHSAATFDPEAYALVLYYDLPTTAGGFPVPAAGINCELDRRVMDRHGVITQDGKHDANGKCCVVGLRHVAKVTSPNTKVGA